MKYSQIHAPVTFFLILLLCCPVLGQQTFQKAFSKDKTYIGASDVLAASDGYLLCGESDSSSSGPNSRPFLMKIGPDGNELWCRHYGTGFQTAFYKIIEANDGGFLAVGTSVGGFNTQGDPLPFLVKTDTAGAIEWQKIIPSYATNRKNGANWVYAVGDGYIVSGSTKRGDTHAFLTKINNQGETVWSKRYFHSFFDHPRFYSHYVRGDTIYAVGTTDSLALFTMISASTGSVLSIKAIEGPPIPDQQHTFISMAPAPDGDWLLAGSGIGKLWVCRVGRTGALHWSNTYPPLGFGRVTALSDGNFLITQVTGSDPVLFKINGNGDVIWSYNYGLSSEDRFSASIETPDARILAAGGVELSGYTHGSKNGFSILTVKTDANGLVNQCCSQALDITAVSYPVTVTDAIFNQTDFDNTMNLNIEAEADPLNALDYCPPLPDYTTVSLCPGDSIVLDGKVYKNPGQVLVTIPGATCDTSRLYDIKTGVNPVLNKDTSFCRGDTLILFGQVFTAPAVFTQAVPAAAGRCDTLVNWHILYANTGLSTALTVQCPKNRSIHIPYDALSTPVSFGQPAAQSDCLCPGIEIQQTLGPPSGASFPVGSQTLCFEARDSCGNVAACCFQIQVIADDTLPCDAKTNGCISVQLLRVSADAKGSRTYHIRLQNNCTAALTYAAFQLPPGVVADTPADGSVYEAPSGRLYDVRNPNQSPIYSIRFKASGAGLANGASDLFRFSLPPWSAPDYINTVVKLAGQPFLEAHLNTFNCPLEHNTGSKERDNNSTALAVGPGILLFPNPASGTAVQVALSGWGTGPVRLRIWDARGQLAYTEETTATVLTLQAGLPRGVYFVEATAMDLGWREVRRLLVW